MILACRRNLIRRFLVLASAAFLLPGSLSGEDEPSIRPSHVVEEYYEELLELDPLQATYNGDHRFDDRPTIGIAEIFDVRGFHEVILNEGAMPLGVLERRVEAWIEEQGE